MRGHLKFTYEALNWTAANRFALNWTMQTQTKACIAKSSWDICAFKRYYAL
jgi:hypothetical protein